MKLGYSMLLGEHVPAAELAHKDCEYFQIVCPACREPTFKVEQAWPGELRHYLSHYRHDEAYPQECELRVRRLRKADIDRLDGSSRDQKLAFFLRVLERACVATYFARVTDEERKSALRGLRLTLNKRPLSDIRAAVFDSAVSGEIDSVAEFDRRAAECHAYLPGPATTFSFERQQRIARDIYVHVRTPNARRSFNFLFNFAACKWRVTLTLQFEQGLLKNPKNEMRAAEIHLTTLGALLGGSEIDGRAALQFLASSPPLDPGDHRGMGLIPSFLGTIEWHTVGMLLGLPYFELLREGFDLSRQAAPAA